MTPFSPDLLECLAAVIEEGGFERAARRLSITQSAVSQRLHALEAQAGTVLVVRGRPLRPTPAGRLLLRHAMQMRLLHTGLEQDLRQFVPGAGGGSYKERISIAVNADSIATWALPAFNKLQHEGIAFEIIADDQDFTQDWLREGQVLGCVTALAHAMRGCRITSLGAMHYVAVATPDTLHKHCPNGVSLPGIRQLPFIAFNRKDDLQTEFVRRVLNIKQVNLRQSFVPSSEGQVRAVLAGWGASVVPELLVRPLLESGQLVNLAPDATLPVNLYWHCWNLDSQLLDALTGAIQAAAARCLAAECVPASLD